MMKIEVEILEDQIEFLGKIKELPEIIENHIGKFAVSFPMSNEVGRITELCESLEFKCKKWIFDTIITKQNLSELLNETCLAKKSEYIYEEDYI